MKTTELSITLVKIGEALGQLRIEKGYHSIKEFAAANSLPLIQYWRIERGKANLTIKSLVKLLAIHEVSVHDFFCNLKNIL